MPCTCSASMGSRKIGRTKGVFALGAYHQAIRLSRLAARALPERRRGRSSRRLFARAGAASRARRALPPSSDSRGRPSSRRSRSSVSIDVGSALEHRRFLLAGTPKFRQTPKSQPGIQALTPHLLAIRGGTVVASIAGGGRMMKTPVVMITGAVTGIGRVTAFAFAKEGPRRRVGSSRRRRESLGRRTPRARR
jgi:hypothetical protein